MADFVHLRLHSEYSIIDGLINPKKLFAALKKQNVKAVALSDESNLFAVIKMYKAAQAAGIKLIIGADILIVEEKGKAPYRLTLLCQNNAGYKNLTKLISRGFLEAKRPSDIPIIPRNWLTKESLQGLIALSGATEGDIGRALIANHTDRAKTWLKNWQVLFDNNRFYIELQRVGKLNEDAYINGVLPLASEFNIPVVATNDVRFLARKDFMAHEVRVCIHDGYTLEDPKRPRNYTDQQYLKSPDKMAKLFADIPSAIANTEQIAKRCTLNLSLGEAHLPSFPVPKEGVSLEEYFIDESKKGLNERLVNILDVKAADYKLMRQKYDDRLQLEIDVIVKMGFVGYFMVVADFIQWSKNNDIPVGPGRGSGAGSLVAYALKITDLDPIEHGLLFERFLNPERVSMPDFDIDFCMDGRDRVIDYVAQKYGRDCVSQIVTFGTMAAKAVVRDVGRVLNHPYGFVDVIAKLIPTELGITLAKALEDEPLLKERYDNEEEVKAILDMGLALEGTVRNVGKHAGGVVIAPTKLTDFTAIYCEQGGANIVSQFDKNDVESAGLVKFDFLGLRNLTIIASAVKIINAIRKKEGEQLLDISKIPMDDDKAFALLKRCDTTAIFQLESRGMQDLVRRLQPDDFDDLMALVALFRPGPLQSGMVDDFINRKHKRAPIVYPHPETKPILQPTYGIILYQEQVMKIPQVLAGYSLGDADILRRAMGKKKPEEMARQREVFVKGAIKNNVQAQTAEYLFDLMEKFAGYGFNKSHSAAYALVSYQTAWLKAHFPAAFMAAVLSSDMDNTDKVVVFMEDCEHIGVKVSAPSINKSRYKFTVDGDDIVFGLGAIKGVGESAIGSILKERKSHGPFVDLFDFCARVDLQKVNKRTLEALIWSGAMDELGPSREALAATMAKAMQLAQQKAHNKNSGQDDLFSVLAKDASAVTMPKIDFVNAPLLPKTEWLLKEKSMLGLFVSGHPITFYEKELRTMHIKPLAKLKVTRKGEITKLAGMVMSSRRIKTKRGNVMRVLVLDDKSARVEVTVFSDVLDEYKHIIKVDALLIVEAEIRDDEYSGGLRISAKCIYTMDEARNHYAKRVKFMIDEEMAKQKVLPKLYQIVKKYRAATGVPCEIHYQNAKACVVLNCGEDIKINICAKSLEQIYKILPKDRVEVEY